MLPLTWLAAKDVFECADPMGSIQEERSPDLVDQEWDRAVDRPPVCTQKRTRTLNAIRAAFRAGLKPAIIARQFGYQRHCLDQPGRANRGPAEPILNHKGAVSQSRRWSRFLKWRTYPVA